MNFKKCTSKVKGYYYYCTICNKQIDYYEHLKYDGKCELCYYCYSELTIIKIIVYAYDKFDIDKLKRFNKYGQLKENNISKAIREFLPILGHEVIIKLIDKSNNRKEFIKELTEGIKEKWNVK